MADQITESFGGDLAFIKPDLIKGTKFYRGWNELKVTGKLPDRRSYHVSCVHEGYMYAFGGLDAGAMNNFWRLELQNIIEGSNTNSVADAQWELLDTKGDKPGQISHNTAFVNDGKIYSFGGIASTSDSNFFVLDIASLKWNILQSQKPYCEPRDDHGSYFCEETKSLYVFGGYVDGDKANDLWKFDIAAQKWTCLNAGDYKAVNQNPKKVPAPRIGCRMFKVGSSIYVHNGHDNDNEKLADLWAFDETTETWNQIYQKGDIPHGRNGHTLEKFRDYLLMFGGILEVTKESDDIYIMHIPSATWKLIDMNDGPLHLDALF